MSTVKFSFGEPGAQAGRSPFRLAVMAEYLPRDYETGKPDSRYYDLPVDKDNFNEAMVKAGMRLCFDIKNPLAQTPKELHIDLPLNLIKTLRPDNIVRTVPELKSLLEVREMLVELKQQQRTVSDFAVRIATYDLPPGTVEEIAAIIQPPRKTGKKSPPPPPPPTDKPAAKDSDTIENILDMIETGQEQSATPPAGSRIKDALDDFVRGDKPPSEKINVAAIQKAIAAVDAALGQGVDAIIHHPEFKRIERLWRGLKYLVDQTNFRKNIKLEIINTDKDHLLEVFNKQIYQPEYDGLSEIPLAAVVLAFEFDAGTPDIDLLRELGQKAAEIPLVVLGSVGASFFGLEESAKLESLPYLNTLLESPEYVKFNGLRDDPNSRWLALGFNRFLLRFPYGHEGWAIKSFDYRESIDDGDDYTWGNPVWGLASLMTISYAKTGWATQIGGRSAGSTLEDLAVHPFALPNGETVNIPLETIVSDRRLREFDHNGIIPLLCDSNSDDAYFLAEPSVNRPRHDADAAKAEKNAFMASLPYQMYAGEVARFINRRYNELTSGAGAAEIESHFAGALAAFNITRDEPGQPGRIKTRVAESSTAPGKQELTIEISSPPQILHGRAVVQMSLPLRT
jgi:type VI secretion system protein ImpC